MKEENFYLDKNGEKMNICKKCLTMHINVLEPSTTYAILKMVNVPFIPSEWEALVERYAKDPTKVNSTTIIGRYLAKMKLKQFSDLTWEDTDRLIEEHNIKLNRIRQAEQEHRDRFKQALISEGKSEEEAAAEAADSLAVIDPHFDFGSMLSKDEKQAMTLKWGKLYREEEWLYLEQFYNDMHNSYDIQTASHEDYLKMIAKTSLKMNQAIDIGQVEDFQKLSKTYDALMKSAKFTAAQNRAESENYIDSIGEMVALCEAEGFIPRYHDEEHDDIVDITIKDMTNYLDNLVKNELNLGTLIESALKQMENEQNKADFDSDSDESLWDDSVLTDQDYAEFSEFIVNESEEPV
jgi:hypothetical protein